METVEKECGALGGLFQAIVNDMKVNESLFIRICCHGKHMCSLSENSGVLQPIPSWCSQMGYTVKIPEHTPLLES